MNYIILEMMFTYKNKLIETLISGMAKDNIRINHDSNNVTDNSLIDNLPNNETLINHSVYSDNDNLSSTTEVIP